MPLTDSDLRWLLEERNNLDPARVERIEAALDGDDAAWAAEEADYDQIQHEIVADYAAESRAHYSPADYR